VVFNKYNWTILFLNLFKQRTIKSPIAAEGVALHSGKTVNIRLLPAPANTGVVFKRVDVNPPSAIQAKADNVSETRLSTTLSNGECKIALVEHFLSAVAGLGIDNLIVEVNHDEMPIMDGSASPFVFLIQSSGIEVQDAEKKFIKILEEVSVEMDDKKVSLAPSDSFIIDYSIDFGDNYIKGENRLRLEFSATSFISEISRSRTFGFEKDIENLRKVGMIKGGTLSNAIVLKKDGILNEDGLRTKDELVKHKILDAIGDLYLLGFSLLGEYKAHKAGHHLNNLLLRKLLKNKDSWEVMSFESDHDLPISYDFGGVS